MATLIKHYELVTLQNRRLKLSCWITLLTLVALIILTLDLCLRSSSSVYQAIATHSRNMQSQQQARMHYEIGDETSDRQEHAADEQPTTMPVCHLGDQVFPLGSRWAPFLPNFGIQQCMRCDCTLKYELQRACYEPVVTCKRLDNYPHCPNKNETCPDGWERRLEPGHCCPACRLKQLTTPSTTVRPKPGSLWQTSNSRMSNQHTLSQQQQAMQSGLSSFEPKYDQAQGRETFWLFKIISRSQDDREQISAVKSISFCRPKSATPTPTLTTTTTTKDKLTSDPGEASQQTGKKTLTQRGRHRPETRPTS